MFRFKTLHLLSLGLLAPVYAYAADYCISVNGGFGGASGGATYVGSNFTVPAAGACVPWSGFTKTATTVIFFTSGTACLSSTGGVLTLSVSSADPDNIGAGNIISDYIRLCKGSGTGCAAGAGSDQGGFAGTPVAHVTCTAAMTSLPPTHD